MKVIVSEGNAAFYEAGCMDAPLQKGYSILGWNHPGFGSSTGKPHPEQVLFERTIYWLFA